MTYIAGSLYGYFKCLENVSKKLTKDDVVILLGNSCINFCGDKSVQDITSKEILSKYPCTFFVIRGNLDMRPRYLTDIYKTSYNNGWVLKEFGYDNIVYAIDGESYTFDNKQYLVIGGGYTIDKELRKHIGLPVFDNENLTEEEKEYILDKIDLNKYTYYGVLTHTCAYSDIPTEVKTRSEQEYSVEIFLEVIKSKLTFKQWYVGKYHRYETRDKIMFVNDFLSELQ